MKNETMQEKLEGAICSRKQEQKLGEVKCQNCGKIVIITLPFYGCVFCSDCMKGESYESADAPEFKRRYSWEKK